MTPSEIALAIRQALIELAEAGELPISVDDVPDTIVVERSKNPEHGDYATNVAMQLAKAARRPPRAIAEALAGNLARTPGVEAAEVAGPGFLNITIEAGAQGALAADIVLAGDQYGRGSSLAGHSFNVEFISANPTGPLHLGHTRWAAVGDALAAVLTAAGAKVDREFYVNDRGNQMELFGASIQAAAIGEPIPADGYQGGYIAELASEVVAADPAILQLSGEEQRVAFREAGYQLQLAQQQETLEEFHTIFDTWYSERALHSSGGVERALDRLRTQGHVYESDGAVWLRTTEFGDDKDRVLIKADGSLTYFASDCAYYVDKRLRGFDTCLYLLGADHHGYVNRLKAVAACAGDDPAETIEILIGQLVKTMRDGQEVKLSKRAGEMVTLTDLIDEVGVDAARYTLIRYPVDSPLTLDLGLLVKRTNDNPVYYVQYAHARIASVLRKAEALGISWRGSAVDSSSESSSEAKAGSDSEFDATSSRGADTALAFDPALLVDDREGDLLRALAEYPRVVATAAELREPHRVARYLEDLGSAYHRFYDACRVLPRGDEPLERIHIARLWLCAATRQTLFNGLTMLGVHAPERM